MPKAHLFCAAAALGLLVGTPVAYAEPACQAALVKTDAAWNAAGIRLPVKPMQALVTLRDGHVASGPEVTWLDSQLRFAAADCAQGRDAEALHRLDRVQVLLSRL